MYSGQRSSQYSGESLYPDAFPVYIPSICRRRNARPGLRPGAKSVIHSRKTSVSGIQERQHAHCLHPWGLFAFCYKFEKTFDRSIQESLDAFWNVRPGRCVVMINMLVWSWTSSSCKKDRRRERFSFICENPRSPDTYGSSWGRWRWDQGVRKSRGTHLEWKQAAAAPPADHELFVGEHHRLWA